VRPVALEEHSQILRLLARRHHQLTAARTRAICRLHAVLCEMTEGGMIEASSGPTKRHRLNPNGSRQLNHALHVAALGQISHDTLGRA
jgi:hypothetical protein